MKAKFTKFKRHLGHILWIVAALLIGSCSAAYGQNKSTFAMPGGIIFFWDGSLEMRLVATAKQQALSLHAYPAPWSYPVVAHDGGRVASGLFASPIPDIHHLTLGVFSVMQQEWNTYGDFSEIGVPGFSPNGERVAFAAKHAKGRSIFVVVDVPGGATDAIDQLATAARGQGPSWSPDGTHLAVGMEQGDDSKIVVYDLGSSKMRVIGKGTTPSWSPTGEWIAYFETPRKCVLVHPDGTGARVLRNLGGPSGFYREFKYSAVWSPSGKQLLLNELKGEGPDLDVTLADVETGIVTKKSRNGLAVVGWARQTP